MWRLLLPAWGILLALTACANQETAQQVAVAPIAVQPPPNVQAAPPPPAPPPKVVQRPAPTPQPAAPRRAVEPKPQPEAAPVSAPIVVGNLPPAPTPAPATAPPPRPTPATALRAPVTEAAPSPAATAAALEAPMPAPVTPAPEASATAAPTSEPRTEPKEERVAPPSMTDAQIIAAIMRASIASYPGNCPCPENTMRNGRRCGGTSAWSRPGGYKPICYTHEVTPAMIQAYRERQLRSRTAGGV